MKPEEYLKEDFEATGHSRYTVDGLEKNDPDGWTRQLLEKGKRPSADNLDDFVAVLYEVGDQ
ncbi:hypothetical protein ACIA4K_07945 [Lactobacillus delbrueckii subsp. bulgaricus]|uniref:hypothetical protein n=1 Tax=Lactobacillus delbrueckii TaxID=1584 RepID=UPI003852EC1F